SAEIGYWLGERFWGRGIATEALAAMTRHAIETHELTRVYAVPFAWNTASCRVLEKAGYVLEARLRRSAIKDGQVVDQLQYAFIPPTGGPPSRRPVGAAAAVGCEHGGDEAVDRRFNPDLAPDAHAGAAQPRQSSRF